MKLAIEEKRNLKTKFRFPLWQRRMSALLALAISFSLLFTAYQSYIAYEGLTFEAMTAYWKASQAFRAIENQDYEKAVSKLGFWGYNEDRTELSDHLIEQEKSRWIQNMKRFDDRYDITEAKVIRSYTDDGFTHVLVGLKITDLDGVYNLLLKVAYYGKHYNRRNALFPYAIYPKSDDGQELSAQTQERIVRIGNDLLAIIYTYNPC